MEHLEEILDAGKRLLLFVVFQSGSCALARGTKSLSRLHAALGGVSSCNHGLSLHFCSGRRHGGTRRPGRRAAGGRGEL